MVSTDRKYRHSSARDSSTNLTDETRASQREFEYIRHGTQSLIANLEIATGLVIAPSMAPTRTEADFLAHIIQTVATDPLALVGLYYWPVEYLPVGITDEMGGEALWH